jgi:shikimate kinase
MKIVLLGYMGSGKSTVARELSILLKLPFKDLDQEIEKYSGASVPEIFKQKGEVFFRKIETKVLFQLLEDKEDFVLSLGGGTPCYGLNMKSIEETEGVVSIYLKANVVELTNRLKKDQEQRPLIANRSEKDLMEFIGKHLFERMPFYERANHLVLISGKTVEQLVEEIAALF